MESKHPYSPHFPSSNKVPVWQENPVQFSPSVAPNSQPKQVIDAENLSITTTPACDVSTSLGNWNYDRILKSYANNFSLIDLGGT